MSKRLDRLAPKGEDGQRIPKWIHVYDDGGKCADRYTVVYTGKRDGISRGVGMSGAPFWPQGICCHFEYERGQIMHGQWPVDRPKYAHLGKKIKFTDLPKDCQRVVLQDYADLWDLNLEQLMEVVA